MAGRSVRVFALGDPNEVVCMDGGNIRVVTMDSASSMGPSQQQMMPYPMPARESSVTKVYCGPVETIGMPAPPHKPRGSRLDWRITPEGALEVSVGRPLTREEEEKRDRDRCKQCQDDKGKAADAKPAADGAPADAAAGGAAGGAAGADAKPAAPKKPLCNPLTLLANKRLPICFETTLGQETPGLSSVTVINEQPGSPVMVQPRQAPLPPGGGTSGPGVKVICGSDNFGCEPPSVSSCGSSFSGVRIRTDSSSSSFRGRRCEPLLPDPCPPAMQTIRIMDDSGGSRRGSSRVVHIFEDPPGPTRSQRGVSRGDRQVTARVVHIEEECPEFM